MNSKIEFVKVPFEVYRDARIQCLPNSDCTLLDKYIEEEWENIKLPRRSTKGSAGYDFYTPYKVMVGTCPTLFPTGISFVTDMNDIFLMCVPRSGLGFKYGTKLRNTVGIIDCDYYRSDNHGHIMAKMTSDVATEIEQGKAFMQGIILPFKKVDYDSTEAERNGGFGSTDNG